MTPTSNQPQTVATGRYIIRFEYPYSYKVHQLKHQSLFNCFYDIYLFSVRWWCDSSVEVREQLVQVNSLLLPCEFWIFNVGLQLQQQDPLPSEPSLSWFVGKVSLGPCQYHAYGCALPHSFALIRSSFHAPAAQSELASDSGISELPGCIKDLHVYKLRWNGVSLTFRNHFQTLP